MDGLGAIVLAGGRGTRMKSAAPKSVHPALGLPLAAWPARVAVEAGAAPVIVVTGDRSGEVDRAIAAGAAGRPLQFALQAEPRGTADAVTAAEEAAASCDHVFILNGDVPVITPATLRALVDAYRASGGALAVLTCVLPDGGMYGRVLRTTDDRFVAIREAKDATPDELQVCEVNAGIYIARRELLFDGLRQLDANNAQGELYLTDLVEVLVGQGRTVGSVRLTDPVEMMGVNNRSELAGAVRVLRDRINERWMAEGVSLLDPPSVWIEPDVTLGRDTVLGTGVVLEGAAAVGADVNIGAHAVIRDARVGDGAAVGAGSVIEGVTVPPGLVIPPLTHLTKE